MIDFKNSFSGDTFTGPIDELFFKLTGTHDCIADKADVIRSYGWHQESKRGISDGHTQSKKIDAEKEIQRFDAWRNLDVSGMRGMTKEESDMYARAIASLSTPTGRNRFELGKEKPLLTNEEIEFLEDLLRFNLKENQVGAEALLMVVGLLDKLQKMKDDET